MTNSQAAIHASWLERCSPHAPGFSPGISSTGGGWGGWGGGQTGGWDYLTVCFFTCALFSHPLSQFLSEKIATAGSQGYVQMTSADFCRMREIENERMFELVYVSRLLWMGGDSLLMPVG